MDWQLELRGSIDLPTTRRIPQLDGPIAVDRGQATSVRAEDGIGNHSAMPLELMREPTVADAPDLHRQTAARDQVRIVRAEGNGVDRVRVQELSNQLAGGHIPKFRGMICTGRDEPAAVVTEGHTPD